MELIWNKLKEHDQLDESENALQFCQWLNETLDAHFNKEDIVNNQTKNKST